MAGPRRLWRTCTLAMLSIFLVGKDDAIFCGKLLLDLPTLGSEEISENYPPVVKLFFFFPLLETDSVAAVHALNS